MGLKQSNCPQNQMYRSHSLQVWSRLLFEWEITSFSQTSSQNVLYYQQLSDAKYQPILFMVTIILTYYQ